MPKTKTLVNETLERLESLLIQPSPSLQEAQSIIKRCFNVAFKQADRYSIDVNGLQRKLLKELSPQQLRKNHSALYSYLVSVNGVDTPLELLAQFPSRGFFNYILNSPRVGLRSLQNYLSEKLEPMTSNVSRYFFLLRLIAGLTYLGVQLGLYLATTALVLPLYAVRFGYDQLKAMSIILLNVVTADAYAEELVQHKMQNGLEPEDAKKEYVDIVRSEYQNTFRGVAMQINDLSDDQIINGTINGRSDKNYSEYQARKGRDRVLLSQQDFERKYPLNEEEEKALCLQNARDHVQMEIMKDSTPANQWQHLKFVLKALFYSVGKPLPEQLNQQLFSLFVARPLILLTAPLFIMASVALELINVLNAALVSMVGLMEVAIEGTTLAVFNAPLFAFDSLCFGINKFKACFKKEAQAEEAVASIPANSYANMPFERNTQEPRLDEQQGSYISLYHPAQASETEEQPTLNAPIHSNR